MEVFCELQTASDLGYITEEDLDNLRPQFTEIAKLLSGLRNSFQAMLEKSDVRPTINNFKPKDHNP
jgi:hypothetical protein